MKYTKTVKINAERHAQVKNLGARYGLSVGWLVDQAVMEACEKWEKGPITLKENGRVDRLKINS